MKNKKSKLDVCAILFHDSLAEVWNSKYKKQTFALRAEMLMSFLDTDDLNGQLWLDAGCGTGILSLLLSEKGCRVIGIDGSLAMIEKAKKMTGKIADSRGDDLKFEQKNIEQLDSFGDNAFDGILCSSVLEYVDQPEICLNEMYRVLKPNGKLILSLPNKHSLVRILQKYLHKVSNVLNHKSKFSYIGHSVNEYTEKTFKEIMKKNGFSVQTVKYFKPQAFLSNSLTSFTTSLFIILAYKMSDVLIDFIE